jgi:hypothetical protein
MTDPFWCPTWYFAIYPRKWSEWQTWFFHCDLWGVTRDETWVFLNPCPAGFEVNVVHKAEEVEALMAARLGKASRVYRYEGERIPRSRMPIAPLTCASICAHVLGFRAWTPHALERKLVANGAVLIWEASDETTERGS